MVEFIPNIIASRLQVQTRIKSSGIRRISGGSCLPSKGPSRHLALYHTTADVKSQHKNRVFSNLKEASLIPHLPGKARDTSLSSAPSGIQQKMTFNKAYASCICKYCLPSTPPLTANSSWVLSSHIWLPIHEISYNFMETGGFLREG